LHNRSRPEQKHVAFEVDSKTKAKPTCIKNITFGPNVSHPSGTGTSSHARVARGTADLTWDDQVNDANCVLLAEACNVILCVGRASWR
jgi:hypothetical protein